MFTTFQKQTTRLFLLLTLLTAVLLTQTTAKAATAIVPSPQTAVLADPAELEAFMDDYLAEQMAAHHIPGAVITVVKDGELFFSKGYGQGNRVKLNITKPTL